MYTTATEMKLPVVNLKDMRRQFEWQRWYDSIFLKQKSVDFIFLFIKTWDDELAQFAEYNVRRCIFDHDKCHNTGT